MPPEAPSIRLGTCSWSLREWIGKFYTTTESTDFIRDYATKLSTVEIDSTFYGTPRRSTIEGWRDRTPETFVFAAKAPQLITHEKFLRDCERDLAEFLDAMSILGPRLGPILFQFPYYARAKKVGVNEFLDRLTPFLDILPRDNFRFAVEIRNKAFLGDALFTTLRQRAIPLALIDHPYMPPPEYWLKAPDFLTGPFAYFRWLGDRYAIEKLTTKWNESLIDRKPDLLRWVPVIKHILDKRVPAMGYVNSHYSGYAPGDVETLSRLLQ
jgi:uncharacterized protein YecE (DUF72 family)